MGGEGSQTEVAQSICRGGTSMKMAELHKSNRMDWPDGCQ